MCGTESNLVARAVDGDADALSALLREYGPQVRQKLSIGPTWQAVLDAADVMQVTYLEAFLQIGRLSARQTEVFVAWLTRMAEDNLRDAIKELERAKRPNPRCRVHPSSPEESTVTLLGTLGCMTDTASRLVSDRESRRLLDEAITRLPETYEKVIRLHDLDGRSVEEVAEALERSPGAVYMLRARAHDRLREILGPQSRFFTDFA